MAIKWTCRHFDIDCDHEATGETEEEVKKKWSEHAHARHPLDELPDYIRDKVRAVIREES